MRIALVFPELLGTYGDGGNAVVLAQRLERRGLPAEMMNVGPGEAFPDADLYLLGGGEDGPQRLAADLLIASTLAERVADGAGVFAVCAGLQLLGTSFAVEGEAIYPGLDLVPALTVRGIARSVGDAAVRVEGRLVVGFENHGGVTHLAPGLDAFGEVVVGHGNDTQSDGFRAGRVWATYLHGPVLAQNPWLADALLASVLGHELEPLASVADDLYAARCAQLTGTGA